jgi:hypothetical protein
MNKLPTDIKVAWISGMPRSGTTWLSQIFASSPDVRLKSCPLFSYEFKNTLNESSASEDWTRLFNTLYTTKSDFLDQEHLRKKGLILSFNEKKENPQHLIIKSTRFHHLMPYILKLNTSIHCIHIVRHPCATIYSWLSDPDEFPLHANPLEEWRTGKCRKNDVGEFWGFDDWKKVTTQALRLSEQYPAQHIILRYEYLLKNTEHCIKTFFDLLEIPYTNRTHEFIKLSHSKPDDHKHSVFKNPSLMVNWKENLDPTIASQCLDEVRGTELAQFIES